MDGLSTKDLVGVILGIVFLVTIVFVRGSSSRRQPKDRFFNCWRCKALTPHNQRTMEAWRNEKTHFFCGACHTKWLQSHPVPPAQARPAREYRPRRRSSPLATLMVLGAAIVISVLARSCS
jgi:hypothetical protein